MSRSRQSSLSSRTNHSSGIRRRPILSSCVEARRGMRGQSSSRNWRLHSALYHAIRVFRCALPCTSRARCRPVQLYHIDPSQLHQHQHLFQPGPITKKSGIARDTKSRQTLSARSRTGKFEIMLLTPSMRTFGKTVVGPIRKARVRSARAILMALGIWVVQGQPLEAIGLSVTVNNQSAANTIRPKAGRRFMCLLLNRAVSQPSRRRLQNGVPCETGLSKRQR